MVPTRSVSYLGQKPMRYSTIQDITDEDEAQPDIENNELSNVVGNDEFSNVETGPGGYYPNPFVPEAANGHFLVYQNDPRQMHIDGTAYQNDPRQMPFDGTVHQNDPRQVHIDGMAYHATSHNIQTDPSEMSAYTPSNNMAALNYQLPPQSRLQERTPMQLQNGAADFDMAYAQWMSPVSHYPVSPSHYPVNASTAIADEMMRQYVEPSRERGQYGYNGSLATTSSSFIRDTETQSYVEASPMQRDGFSPMLSNFAIARGMQSSYDYKVEDRHQSQHQTMHFDQQAMYNLAARTYYPEMPRHTTFAPSGAQIVECSPAKDEEGSSSQSVVREEANSCGWIMSSDVDNIVICNETFDSPSELTAHLKVKHVGSRKSCYTCQWHGCDRREQPFQQKQKIMRHLVVHTQDRPFKCTEVPDCGYSCSEESALKQHIRKHTGDKPFLCEVCKKTFRASTSLSVHRRVHTKSKPLPCKFCGKGFSESSNLTKHERTHSTAKRHQCDHVGCNAIFKRPDQLKRHKRTVHSRTIFDVVPEREDSTESAMSMEFETFAMPAALKVEHEDDEHSCPDSATD